MIVILYVQFWPKIFRQVDTHIYVGTKMRKFPLLVIDMPVSVLGSVCILAHALTGTGNHMYGCVIIRILFCFSYHFTYLPP
jgi:hypothetical protein